MTRRVVVDLQAALGANRTRGLGRYSWQLARALGTRDDLVVTLLVQSSWPSADIVDLRRRVAEEIPTAELVVYDAPWPWQLGETWSVDAHEQAEEVRDLAIRALRPDAVLVTSPFESSAETVLSVPADRTYLSAVVGYDLLPLTDVTCAPPAAEIPLYRRRVEAVGRADLVLAISEHTAADFGRLIPSLAGRVVPIWGAAVPLPHPSGSRRDRSVVCAGGAHARKNVQATIEAFARIPARLRQRHPLTILGNYDERARGELVARAGSLGVAPGEISVPGEVSDAELAGHYWNARIVTMPSLGEGLGLPVLEAWAAGAPAICSATTSLGELIPDPRFNFDPTDIGAQSERLMRALTDEAYVDEVRNYGAERARTFTWDLVAERVVAAIEASIAAARPAASAPRSAPERPTLALVTPWPPDESGIAKHARQLLPALTRHYQVTLVPETEAGAAAAASVGLEVVAPDVLLAGVRSFDRVVYNMGNHAGFHSRALDLSTVLPGVMIAHDPRVSGLLGASITPPDIHVRSYLERGLAAMGNAAYWGGSSVYGRGLAVVCHSRVALDYLEPQVTRGGGQLYQVPLVLLSDQTVGREQARGLLGLKADAFVVATFGLVAPHKGVHLVVEGFSTAFPSADGSLLAVVGGFADPELESELTQEAGERVLFTGRVGDDEYGLWLAACDVAVQLRPESMGESSGPALEALAFGAVVVAERSGSMAELGELGALLVDSPAVAEELASTLVGLRADPQRRSDLARRGRELVLARHRADSVEVLLHAAIEAAYREPWIPTTSGRLTPRALADVARNSTRRGRSILFDVSRVAGLPERSGSERVTLRLAQEVAGLASVSAYPVSARDRITHAPELADAQSRLPRLQGWRRGRGHHIVAGDVLVSAELMLHDPRWRAGIADFKARGGRYIQFVHDLLPIEYPEFFVRSVEAGLPEWLTFVTGMADVIICDSEATRTSLTAWANRTGTDLARTQVTTLRLGYDLDGLRTPVELRTRRRGRSRVLVVGTVEPRKGYEAMMDAAEALWRSGADVSFTVVGRAGWAARHVIDRLAALADSEHPLTWLQEATDLDLKWEYLNTDLVVAPSRGEGFGLPVVEALAHGVPVLARDLPVFRELLGDEGDYFRLDRELPDAILARLGSDAPVASVPQRLVTWRESAADLLGLIEAVVRDPRQSNSTPGGGMYLGGR